MLEYLKCTFRWIKLGNYFIPLLHLNLIESRVNGRWLQKHIPDGPSIFMQSLKYSLRYLHGHDPSESRMLCAGLECLISGLTSLGEFSSRHLTIAEKILNHLDWRHKELIQRVVRAESLHANDLASDLSIELEANCHLAALGQWAVLSKQNHIEHFLDLIVSDPKN